MFVSFRLLVVDAIQAASTTPPRDAAVDEEDAALQRRIDSVAAELARLKELQARRRRRANNPEADRPSPTDA